MADPFRKLRERGTRLVNEGSASAAREQFEQILAQVPDDIAALTRVAELSRDLGDVPRAIAAFQALALSLAADGLLLRAIAASKQILALDPSHTETQERLSRFSRPVETDDLVPPGAPRERRSIAPQVRLQDLVPRTGDLPEVSALPVIPLFSELPREVFVELVVNMKLTHASPGSAVIREGERGDSFFVLSRGRVRVEKRSDNGAPKVLAELSDGAFFGEMALLSDEPRNASVMVEEPSEILELDRALLDRTVARYPSVKRTLRDFYQQRLLTSTLQLHPFFSVLSERERKALITKFSSRHFDSGEVLIHEGRPGRGLYVLLTGKLEVTQRRPDQTLRLATLSAGDLFGEMSLLEERPAMATVTSVAESIVLRLEPEPFAAVIADRPELSAMLLALAEGRSEENRSSEPPPARDVLI